ncbi:glycoside hydrolase family 28 protein [Gorillibacterium sp. sgz5001074]|uniref:glycoside hydrolase family 28 protein n=1 Tax=Gorillibacterium sp. sgz5001074 TaxID=3446695 RepID=UPI003F66ADA0
MIINPTEKKWTMPEVQLPAIPDREFRLTDYGAVGDGVTDNTEAFRKAIADCSAAGGGRIVIPAGLWLTGPLKLASRLELHAEAGATVLFSKRFSDYPLIASTFEGLPAVRCQSPLDAEGCEDIAITGTGVFDGGGEAWRPVKDWKMTDRQWKKLAASGGVVDEANMMWWPSPAAMNGGARLAELLREGKTEPADFLEIRDYLRPNLLSFRRCKRVLLQDATFQNSPAWNLHPWACEHVTLRGVTVRNPWFAQNGDGLDLDSCKYALVENCSFDVGDDAICMKSGKDKPGRDLGMPLEYVTIRNCIVYHGHGGFVVGSEMSGGVRYVDVSDCTFMGTDIGIRFKSARGRGGVVEDIAMRNIRMVDIVGEAISFSLFYEGKEGSGEARDQAFPVTEETPVFRNITIDDCVCTGAETAFLINGLAEMPVEGLTIRNYLAEAKQGVVCHNAKKLRLEDLRLTTAEGPLVKLHQCEEVDILRLTGSGSGDSRMLTVSGSRSGAIDCRQPDTAENCRAVAVAPEVTGRVEIHSV